MHTSHPRRVCFTGRRETRSRDSTREVYLCPCAMRLAPSAVSSPLMASSSVVLSRRGGHDGLAEQEHVESNPLVRSCPEILVEAPAEKR